MSPTNSLTLNPSATNLSELAALHASLLVGVIGDAITTGQSGDTATPSTPIITNRPWIDPPEGFVPFDEDVSTIIPLPPVGTTVTVLSITVPDGMDGVINAYSWNFTGGGFVQGSGDLVVQILRNTAAVRNFQSILVEKGTPQQPRVINPIRIYSGQTVSLTINHVNNGLLAGNVLASFVGYYYPSKS